MRRVSEGAASKGYFVLSWLTDQVGPTYEYYKLICKREVYITKTIATRLTLM